MPPAFIDRTRSRAAFEKIARHVVGGESGYAHRHALGRWFVSVARGPDEIDARLHAGRAATEDLSQ